MCERCKAYFFTETKAERLHTSLAFMSGWVKSRSNWSQNANCVSFQRGTTAHGRMHSDNTMMMEIVAVVLLFSVASQTPYQEILPPKNSSCSSWRKTTHHKTLSTCTRKINCNPLFNSRNPFKKPNTMLQFGTPVVMWTCNKNHFFRVDNHMTSILMIL